MHAIADHPIVGLIRESDRRDSAYTDFERRFAVFHAGDFDNPHKRVRISAPLRERGFDAATRGARATAA